MVSPVSPQSEIFSACERWADRLEGLDDEAERMAFIKTALPELLMNRGLWMRMLQSLVDGGSYPDLRQATMFEDELILYTNSKRLFSLRMFIYDAGSYTAIHDHNAWGVIGSAFGQLEIVRYQREDDGSRDGYARLRPAGRCRLQTGQIDVTYPLDAGIHQTGNPTEGTSIMLSAYGNPIRRLHINRFDVEGRQVTKMYPPRMQKKILARKALEALSDPAA